MAFELMAQGAAPLTEDSMCPFVTTPQYSQGAGGADKTDKPDEKRPFSNTSEPRAILFSREMCHMGKQMAQESNLSMTLLG